jgi:hypothetical protein
MVTLPIPIEKHTYKLQQQQQQQQQQLQQQQQHTRTSFSPGPHGRSHNEADDPGRHTPSGGRETPSKRTVFVMPEVSDDDEPAEGRHSGLGDWLSVVPFFSPH